MPGGAGHGHQPAAAHVGGVEALPVTTLCGRQLASSSLWLFGEVAGECMCGSFLCCRLCIQRARSGLPVRPTSGMRVYAKRMALCCDVRTFITPGLYARSPALPELPSWLLVV